MVGITRQPCSGGWQKRESQGSSAGSAELDPGPWGPLPPSVQPESSRGGDAGSGSCAARQDLHRGCAHRTRSDR